MTPDPHTVSHGHRRTAPGEADRKQVGKPSLLRKFTQASFGVKGFCHNIRIGAMKNAKIMDAPSRGKLWVYRPWVTHWRTGKRIYPRKARYFRFPNKKRG